jgi:hypothetical protein
LAGLVIGGDPWIFAEACIAIEDFFRRPIRVRAGQMLVHDALAGGDGGLAIVELPSL